IFRQGRVPGASSFIYPSDNYLPLSVVPCRGRGGSAIERITMSISNRNFFQSLTRYWGNQFAGAVPTIYPGMQDDATEYNRWVELQVPIFRELAGSSSDLQRHRFYLDVHCFSR